MCSKLLISLPKLSAQGGVSSYWNAILPLLNQEISLKTLEVGGHGLNPFGLLLDQWRFQRALSNTPPNVAIINPSLGLNSFFRDGLFAQKLNKAKIPFIVFFHGWHHEFEQKVSKKYHRFFRNSFGHASTILVLSHEAKRTLQTWGYQGNIVVETTTLEASLIEHFSFEKKISTLHQHRPLRILFLARLIKEKGIYELLDAFRSLSQQFKNLELVIAGDGAILNELKTEYQEFKNIIWKGHVQGEAKISLFSSADIYVLPSYSEGLPISLLEAMAFGLPIITTPVGGLKTFFQEGKMGYTVEVGSAKSLQEVLEKLLHNQHRIIEMGHYNHHYAKTHLLNHSVAQRILHYINKEINPT